MDEWVNERLDQWVQAKRIKDFAVADRIRDELRAEGIEPDKARPAPMPGQHLGGQLNNSRPDGPRYGDFPAGRGGGPMGRPGPMGGFQGGAPPAAPFAPQNDPQFLEHLDQLMHRQNQMEAQLIQMQAQLQATNDIMDQQQQLLASAGLTPLGRPAAPGSTPAATALPSEPITRNGQSVSLAPPPSNDALLSGLGSLGAPPVMPPLGALGAGGIAGLPGGGVLDGGAMGGLGVIGPIGGAAPLPSGPPPVGPPMPGAPPPMPGVPMPGMPPPLPGAPPPPLPGAPPPPLPGSPPPGVGGKRGVDAAGL